jgi:hypothetical protein
MWLPLGGWLEVGRAIEYPHRAAVGQQLEAVPIDDSEDSWGRVRVQARCAGSPAPGDPDRFQRVRVFRERIVFLAPIVAVYSHEIDALHGL